MIRSDKKLSGKLIDGVLHPGGLELTKRLANYCSFAPKEKIVDLGCGVGTTVEYLTDVYGLDVVGVDISREAIQKGKNRNPHLQLVEGSGEKLPFRDGSLQGVIAECSLSVMQYAEEVLNEINRVLDMEGKLGINDLYIRERKEDRSTACKPKRANCLTGALEYPQLVQVLENSGFQIIHWEDHSPCLKEFVARYIMEYGSLADFFQCKQEGTGQGFDAKNKMGYFLLVAKKIKNINS